jgi:hypothetical protein
MAFNLKDAFADLKKKTQEKEQQSGNSFNSNLLKFKAGNTYRFRLLYTTSANRTSPFIFKQVHSFWEDEKKRSTWVTCPTSDHLASKSGGKCSVCSRVWKIYKGIPSDTSKEGQLKKMFDKYKRQPVGFVPVYIVSDPTTPDNNGTMKILKYGFGFHDFTCKKIFEIDPKTKKPLDVDPEESIGSSAFDLDAGYDVICQVTQKKTPVGDFLQYNFDFSKKLNKVNTTVEEATKYVEELGFDTMFLTESTQEELDSFENYILHDLAGFDNLTVAPQASSKKQVETKAKVSDYQEDNDELPMNDEPKKKVTPPVAERCSGGARSK